MIVVVVGDVEVDDVEVVVVVIVVGEVYSSCLFTWK